MNEEGMLFFPGDSQALEVSTTGKGELMLQMDCKGLNNVMTQSQGNRYQQGEHQNPHLTLGLDFNPGILSGCSHLCSVQQGHGEANPMGCPVGVQEGEKRIPGL